MALGTAALFFASPRYPWYFVWLVALLTAAPWWPAWWLTLSAVLLYCNHTDRQCPVLGGVHSLWRLCILGIVDLSPAHCFDKNSGARRAELTAHLVPDPRRYLEAVGDARGEIAEQEPVSSI